MIASASSSVNVPARRSTASGEPGRSSGAPVSTGDAGNTSTRVPSGSEASSSRTIFPFRIVPIRHMIRLLPADSTPNIGDAPSLT